jgi:hypothetical protein
VRDLVRGSGLFPYGGPGPPASHALGSAPVNWFFSGLLIAASAGIFGFTGYLLRRLFTTEPGTPDVSREVGA